MSGMSTELQVIVNQIPGSVEWNFEELKTDITNALEVYKTTTYDDDNIKDAKADVAMLRKLKKSVEDRRKEIKNKCLEPYALIEVQAKQLSEIIDEPIMVISNRVNKYETERRKKCREAIEAYMNKAFAWLNKEIAAKAKNSIYDTRWENATAKEKDWKSVIDNKVAAIKEDLNVISSIEEEFVDSAMTAYKQNLRLDEVIKKVQELRNQKEIILKRQQEEQAQTADCQELPYGKTVPNSTQLKNLTTDTPIPEEMMGRRYTVQIIGSLEQYKKVLKYIEFLGAKYQEV